MARDFDATDDGFTLTAPVTSTPLTLACWFMSDSLALGQTLVSLNDTGGFSSWLMNADGTDPGDVLKATAINSGGGSGSATSSTAYSINVWQHGVAVFTSATSRAVYLNGGNSGTDTTSMAPTGIDTAYIGHSGIGASEGWTSGSIAEVAIWNVALTANEALMLASGVSPLRVRAGSLVAYAPLLGVASAEPDYAAGAGTTWTIESAPSVVSHAPVGPMFDVTQHWQGAFTGAAAPAEALQDPIMRGVVPFER